MRLLFLWGVLLSGSAASPGPEAHVTFRFERAGMEAPRYAFVVSEDGRTAYHAELSARGTTPLPPVDRQLELGKKTTAKVFDLAHAANRFHDECASKIKNIADTGKKTLTYSGPGDIGECTFNYSESKPVTALTELFLGMEATLEAGRRLDFKRRFDRLGLDAEMITLGALLESHQAAAVETIVPTLQAIANDSELLTRVRSRAEKMLQMADASR